MPAIVQVVVIGSLGLAVLAAQLPGLCAALLISVSLGTPAVLMWAQEYGPFRIRSGQYSFWILIKRDPWTLGRGNTA